VLSGIQDIQLGRHGFVDSAVREKLASSHFDRVLACGPKPMLKAVARVCKELGVPLQVSLEERMACGIGACLGCACKTVARNTEADYFAAENAHNGNSAISGASFHYRHVCKDGPVFNAEEVVWDD
jgi:dihydroorotate dehydrogenase electron transfer subunit